MSVGGEPSATIAPLDDRALETLAGREIGGSRVDRGDARNLETRAGEARRPNDGDPRRVDLRALETRASDGASRAPERAGTREDPDLTPPRQHLLDRVRATPAATGDGELREIGRYLVLSGLGAGGMGVVYRAYDPDLDRRVAIKLLKGQGGADARTRLMREAQAMAKLSHPCVVPVFDVGLVGDRIFVAMDFVDGQDLGSWISAGPHPWEEVLDVFLQAGAGLAAAHAVGLIHRDFKPDNVLLSRDAASHKLRAQVADFGLARLGDEPEAAPTPAARVAVSNHSALQENLTRAGSVIGTPAYMSPEQHAGVGVDARTDQFSYAVSFYEALYQRRPFDGDTMEALADGARGPRRAPPPPGSRVPSWLHKIVLRAMAADREARFPTMEALLQAIEARRGRGRRRLLMAAGGVAIAAVAAAVGLRESRPPLCAGGPAKVAGAWNGERRAAGDAAFRATGKSYAVDAWTRAEARVDAYASAWVDAYTEACEATQVRGDLSSDVMDLRMICLDRALGDLAVLTDMFQEADVAVVKRAVEAAAELPELSACADILGLRAGPEPPPPALAAEVMGVRERLRQGRSLGRLRKDKEALAALEPLVPLAEALGYGPLVAEVLVEVADAQRDTGAHEPALQSAERALWAAIAGHHDDLVLRALRELVDVIGHGLGRRDEAQRWIDHLRAEVTRRGDPPEELARALLTVGVVELTAGRYDDAEAALTRSIALREEDGAPPIRSVAALNALGAVYVRRGRYAEAQAPVERAIAIITAELGASHPDLVNPLNTLALIHERAARYDAAISTLDRTLALLIAASGPDHPNVGVLHQNLGGMRLYAGDPAGARRELDLSLKILEAALGPDHLALGGVFTLHGELELEEGRLEAARADFDRALTIRRAALGEDHHELALTRVGLARVEVAEGHDEAAIGLCEHALRDMPEGSSDPGDLGIARFTLAQALWSSDPTRARATAEAAIAKFDEAGVTVARQRREAEAWLREHM
ncbi:MAG: serine/threonine-protein kinase [Nannocystaceae bacterium]